LSGLYISLMMHAGARALSFKQCQASVFGGLILARLAVNVARKAHSYLVGLTLYWITQIRMHLCG